MLTHMLNFRFLMVMDEDIEKIERWCSESSPSLTNGVVCKFNQLASSPTLMHIFKGSSEVYTLVSPKKTALK